MVLEVKLKVNMLNFRARTNIKVRDFGFIKVLRYEKCVDVLKYGNCVRSNYDVRPGAKISKEVHQLTQ